MKFHHHCIATLALLFALNTNAFAQNSTTLYLGGGGELPDAAVEVLAKTAGGNEATILVVGWASEIPDDYFVDLKAQFEKHGVKKFLQSARRPESGKEKEYAADFLAKLKQATLVFFTGGKQHKIMSVFEAIPELLTALHLKFDSGTPVGGNSAGENAMGEVMLIGEGSKTDKGMGFLKGILTDSHFVERSHEARLTGGMFETKTQYGIGLDKFAGIIIRDQRHTIVYGSTEAFFYEMESGMYKSVVRTRGMGFDIQTWVPFDCNQSLTDR